MPTLFTVATQNNHKPVMSILKMVIPLVLHKPITLDLKGAGRISPHATIFCFER